MIDFTKFFSAAHARDGRPGPPPYPWQAELAHRLATATPPRAIVAPTGGGKTATIDALIWALAHQSGRSALLRTVGVRTVWAIDRRILVDEVHDHVSGLALRLADAAAEPADALHEIALALQSLTGDGSPPLVATRWRGGVSVDRRSWHPFQPEVITSTVAQVGSRLLFRGYGVGRRSLSVQAALTGVDTTICLDEAHLVEPFRETVEAIAAERGREQVALPPLNVITLTATPGVMLEPAQVATITDADRPLLGTRLTGTKTATLAEPPTQRDSDRRAALLEAIKGHLEAGAGTVACVVNSVRTAIDLHGVITSRLPDVARMILIGPQRPADRARLLRAHRDVLFDRAVPSKPLVIVATQTFEVGLDADVEALVTQSASASALVQRLGRLNRAGTRAGAATIVRDTESWLYAEQEPATWAWLRSLERADGTIDVSVNALAKAPGRPPAATIRRAPALTAEVVDRLVQTEPRPATLDDPDVDAFLRGAQAEPAADVMVAWRQDLRDEESDAAAYREALLRLAPPQPDELVTLSIGRARALLAALKAAPGQRAKLGAKVLDEPDVEGASGETGLPNVTPDRSFGYVVLRGDEHLECAHSGPDEPLRPGDVVVLPSWVGGYADGALAHASAAPVADVGQDRLAASSKNHGSPPFWRLGPAALDMLSPSPRRRILAAAARATSDAASSEERATATAKVATLLAGALDREPADLGLAEAVLDVRRVTAAVELFAGDEPDGLDSEEGDDDEPAEAFAVSDHHEHVPGHVFVLVVRRRREADELRSTSSSPPTLETHARAVAARAAGYAKRGELPELIADTLVLAARAHDHGKSDPRMQAFFRGGSVGLGDIDLAKSTFGTADLSADRAARAAAGLPRDLRHEVESVAILQRALATDGVDGLPPGLDHELLLHLVGTHHGLGRPVPRLPHGGAASREYLARAAGVAGTGSGDGVGAWSDGEWLERFLTVTGRYGPWGSAYLGALLVLADRTVSGEGA